MALKRIVAAAVVLAFFLSNLEGLSRRVSARESRQETVEVRAQEPASGLVQDSTQALTGESTRFQTIVVSYIEYEWWLISWDHNMIVCRVFIDHDELPTVYDVAAECGEEIATAWWFTPPCDDGVNCKGLYLHKIGSQAKEKEVILELPPAVVWVSLEGCQPTPPDNFCSEIPSIIFSGEEPLPEHRILSIQGNIDGMSFVCEGQSCSFPLWPTEIFGSRIEFWAESSYGDTSEHFFAQVRVIDTGMTPQGAGWYVDVFSEQWDGPPLASCTRIWEALPPIGGPPPWLSSPEGHLQLASEEPYFYLAGRLIANGLVDVSTCPTGGRLPNGYADACGLEIARPLVDYWQNQFDERILNVAHNTGIPAQLMKNLFAQESQFWPGIFRVPWEFGLGQITDNGAETLLLWDPPFFEQFCPLVLSEEACEGGYLNLGEKERAILRGALALQAKADCPDCPTGVDLTNVNFSVLLFANMLQSNCAQVARTIYTATESMAGLVSTYEDLWRFTIANYHAGPGCLSFAIHQAWTFSTDRRITWENVKTQFTEPCLGVVPYVEQIAR